MHKFAINLATLCFSACISALQKLESNQGYDMIILVEIPVFLGCPEDPMHSKKFKYNFCSQ